MHIANSGSTEILTEMTFQHAKFPRSGGSPALHERMKEHSFRQNNKRLWWLLRQNRRQEQSLIIREAATGHPQKFRQSQSRKIHEKLCQERKGVDIS